MEPDKVTRKLAAVLVADVVGYSRLMESDEAGTLAQVRSHRRELVEPRVAEHGGRIVKLMGDGLLAEFPSAVEAVSCAAEIQQVMARHNADVPEDRVIEFRIGVNLGDIIVDGEDIAGDGVNIAARLETMAEAGGICVSGKVYEEVHTKLELGYQFLGRQEFKNIAEAVPVFAVTIPAPGEQALAQHSRGRKRRRLSAALVTSFAIALAVVAGLAWIWTTTRTGTGPGTEAGTTAEAPSVAVLPFDNISGDPEQEYFSDGITEDLITDLSRISGMFVIARNSTFRYKGHSPDVRAVGSELGARYVVEGSVRKSGGRVRINAQLIDAATGHHLWAERYDREFADVFDLQDEVVEKIVAALAVKITSEEQSFLKQAYQPSPEAYDTYLRGLDHFNQFTKDSNALAQDSYRKAIELDPNYARAYASAALALAQSYAFDWTDEPEVTLQLALEYGEKALALEDSLPQAHFALSSVYLRFDRYQDAIREARRAVELDPNYAASHAMLAQHLIYDGQPSEGLAALARAKQLNPLYTGVYLWLEGMAHYLLGNTDEAIRLLEAAIERNPEFPAARLLLISIYNEQGAREKAEWEVEELLLLLPNFSVAAEAERTPYRRPEDKKRYLNALRAAGLPE